MSDPITINFTLYRQPVPKQGDRSRHVAREGTKGFIQHYQPAKIRYERDALTLLAQEHRPAEIWTEPIIADIRFYFPWPKSISKKRKEAWIKADVGYKATRPDLDNLEKMLFDAMEGVIYKNDSQIVKKITSKGYSNTPKIMVTLTKVIRY